MQLGAFPPLQFIILLASSVVEATSLSTVINYLKCWAYKWLNKKDRK